MDTTAKRMAQAMSINVEVFRQALQNVGLEPPAEVITDGTLHRFTVVGDRPGSKTGWYILHADEPMAGAFGCWKRGISETWCCKSLHSMIPEEKAAYAAKLEVMRKQREEDLLRIHVESRTRCAAIWNKAGDAPNDHPYLKRKGVQAYGLKTFKDSLLVPVMDMAGMLHGLQFISSDGSKKFKTGTNKVGHFFRIDGSGNEIVICEGYATGATIRQATGHTVCVAFDAGNIMPVTRNIRSAYPKAKIIVAADDDHATEGNPGLTKATEAAKAANGHLAVPEFPDSRGRKYTDFNDLAHIAGLDAVKACIDCAVTRADEVEIGEATTAPNKIRVFEVHDFMALELPPREDLLHPWLPKQGLAMIHAPRGVGKTHVALWVSYAVAAGTSFLAWHAPKPRGVLYIDGEMPAAVLQERIARIAVSNDLEPSAPLRIITPDLQPGGMIDLSRADDQRELQQFLDGISLIVVDNISCLCRAGKENEGESWLPVQEWALQQRAAGRSVLFIHHTGKNGQQRGTSRREDVLDTVIGLRRPGDYTPDQGALFEIHFEKARGIYGAETRPFEAQLTTTPDGHQRWVIKQLEESTTEKVANLLNEGVPQREIAEMLGITKGTVSKAKRHADEQGLLNSQSSFPKVSRFPSLGRETRKLFSKMGN